MTQSSDRYPGYYEITEALLSSEFDSKTYINIAGLIPSFQIIESMNNDSIRGSAIIHDSVGLLETWPLRGEESLLLRMKDSFGEEVTYEMFIYKIDEVKYNNDGTMIYYTIHFVSNQRYKAGLKRLIKSYEKPASEIAKDIFGEFNRRTARPSDVNGFPGSTVIDQGSEEFKELVVDETDGIIKCIIPNYTPMQAYRFLCDRSTSKKYKSCSYRFFERKDAFYFVTDEYMMEKAENENKIFKFTSAAIPRSEGNFALEMNNLQSISSPNKVNTIADVTSGAYKAQAIVLDVLFGRANIKQNKTIYDYNPDDYFRFKDPDSSSGKEERTDKHTQTFIGQNLNEENCKKFLIIKDYDDKNGGVLPGNKFYPDIVLNRNAFKNHLSNVTLTAVGHGRFDITCGDVIHLRLSSSGAYAEGDQKQLNKHLRGTYLVQDLTRSFNQELAKNIYILVKRDWAEANDE